MKIAFTIIWLGLVLAAQAVGIRGTDSYKPAGWSQSLVWLKFNTSDTTNITDYSAVGTNTFYLVKSTAAATNYSFANGCFKTDPYPDPVAYLKSNASGIADGLSTYTIAAWVRDFGSVYGAGIITSRPSNLLNGMIFGNDLSGSFGFWNDNTVEVRGSGVYPKNTWTRVAVVKTSSYGLDSQKMYVNGSFYGQVHLYANTNRTFHASTIEIGINIFSTSFTADSEFDDIYITAYPFTASDALQDYLKGRSIP